MNRGWMLTAAALDSAGLKHFADAVARMRPLLDALVAAPAHRVAEHPAVPNTPGIYRFTEAGRPVYVGQSRKLRGRLRQHTVARARQNEASFAFNIAKAEASRAGVDITHFREVLQADPAFKIHFDLAKTRVAAMAVRIIELADPVERTMFDFYASLALGTGERNKFETH